MITRSHLCQIRLVDLRQDSIGNLVEQVDSEIALRNADIILITRTGVIIAGRRTRRGNLVDSDCETEPDIALGHRHGAIGGTAPTQCEAEGHQAYYD